MVVIRDKKDCCGCNACGDICLKHAITFEEDEEGFWYPKIDKTICVNCGLCQKVCPMLNESFGKKNNFKEPDCYAAEHKSIEVIFSSTTGGMFSALADVMYTQKGYVGGAIHNDDFSVSHFISNRKSDLQKLRRSKDLQSNAEGFYKKVRDLLHSGQKVLVCGLPCQINGLQTFLGKDEKNLITVDLICAGVNSPKVWQKYLKYIEQKVGSKIVYTENKSKEYGWNNLTQKFVFENGEEFFDTKKTSLFIQGYIDSHLYCRPSCYECKFKGFPRSADITIGDYWGLDRYNSSHNSNMGTNVVIINSKKGEEYFEKVKRRINHEETPLEWAINGNPALMYSISKLSEKRDDFFRDLDKMSFDTLINKYSIKRYVYLKNILKSTIRRLKFVRYIIVVTNFSPKAIIQTIKYSGFKNLWNCKGIICGTNCHVNIDRTSELTVEGILTLGRKSKFKGSKKESHLFVGKNAKFSILGNFEIDADNEIIIFENGELIIHGGKVGPSDANSGLRIICGDKIEIMSDVGIGRDVLIRDTNGNSHFINTTGYKPSRPVTIGEKVWLCESCMIMPGVSIGRGAIVGAGSMVTKSIPNHALVSGVPATVVQQNILWKW